MNKKILITGGTGFIGYHLAKKCIEMNWDVTSISTKNPPKIRMLKNIKYVKCDISNKVLIKKKIKLDYNYVVNLAGYVDHSNKKKTFKSHFIGSKNLAIHFKNSKIEKFIQIGSSVEYGKQKSPQKEKKINRQKTYSIYAKSKLLSTKFLLNLNEKINFPATILRLYLVYGTHQDMNRVIPITIINSLKNKNFDCSSGEQYRDFLNVSDVIDAIIRILKKKKTSGKIYNLGSGRPIKIKDVINRICSQTGGGKPLFGKIKPRKDEIQNLHPNIKKISKEINWKPKINLDQGLRKTIKFYKKNYKLIK